MRLIKIKRDRMNTKLKQSYRKHKLFTTVIFFCFLFLQNDIIKAQEQIFRDKQLVTNGRVWDVAFEDLNKDGYTDMVIANWVKPPTIYYNDASGGFGNFISLNSYEAQDSSYSGHGVAINDFNHDNNPDIFFVFNGLNNFIYLSNEGEYLLTDTINSNNSDGLYISLGDVDNDDDIDAIVTNYKQPTTLWNNDGKGNFIKDNAEFGSSGYNAELGDIDNDGLLDVVCSINGAVVVWFNKGDNNFERSAQSIGYQDGYGRIKLADMDNDQNLDIILSNRNNGGSVWSNDGSGKFSETTNNLTKSSTMCVGDIDLDGQNDIIFGKIIWLNNGNSQFTQYETLETEGRILGLWLNDIDNDGDLDLFYSTSILENGLILIKNSTKN